MNTYDMNTRQYRHHLAQLRAARRRKSAQTTGVRRCTSCKTTLPIGQFQKGQEVCRSCLAQRHQADPRWRILRWARTRAKREGKRCMLQLWEMKVPARCPVFGWPLVVGRGRQHNQSPTAVRIYHGPAGEFAISNVRITSKRVQMLTGALQPAEHQRLTRLLLGQLPPSVDAGLDRFDQVLRRRMLHDARVRADKAGLPYELTLEDLVIPATCPVTGCTLRTHRGHARLDSPSMIRIDADAGWVKGNIAVVSYAAAVARSDGTDLEHRMVDSWLRRIGKMPVATAVA